MRGNQGVWICAVCITGVSLTADGSLWAQDWPQWRGPNRNGTAPFSEPKAWPDKLTTKWKVPVGEGYAARP